MKILWKHRKTIPDEGEKFGTLIHPEHIIDTTPGTKPISYPPQRMSYEQKGRVKEFVDKLIKDKVAVPSSSPWAARALIVPKKGCPEGRFVIDYRDLNSATVRDSYPMPVINDLLDTVSGSSWFSALDLLSGFHQIPMSQESQQKTAFVTSEGLFEFRRMPFGLKNAPATFQRAMDAILAGLKWKCCLVYLDDIVIFGKTWQENLAGLDAVLQKLEDKGLTINPKKCQLLCRKIIFLGFEVSEEGTKQDPMKTKAIRKQKYRRTENSFCSLSGSPVSTGNLCQNTQSSPDLCPDYSGWISSGTGP